MQNQPSTRKYHFIYKTIRNDESGAYYVGMHSTDDLEDGYLGSGNVLNRSIKKYGKDKHSRIILEFLPSRAELLQREAEIVSVSLLKDPKCMNLMCGGYGAAGDQNPFFGRKHTEETKRKQAERRLGKAITKETKVKLSLASSAALSKNYVVTGPDGTTYHVKGLKAFCKEHQLVYPTLFATIKKQVPSGGWLVSRA